VVWSSDGLFGPLLHSAVLGVDLAPLVVVVMRRLHVRFRAKLPRSIRPERNRTFIITTLVVSVRGIDPRESGNIRFFVLAKSAIGRPVDRGGRRSGQFGSNRSGSKVGRSLCGVDFFRVGAAVSWHVHVVCGGRAVKIKGPPTAISLARDISSLVFASHFPPCVFILKCLSRPRRF